MPVLTVVRDGLFGNPTVRWQVGFEQGTFPAGFTAGQIFPSNGNLIFSDDVTKNKTFSAQVRRVKCQNT